MISVETGKDFIAGDDWVEYLPLIQWNYNTTPTYMTNHAPQEIIFGNRYNEKSKYKLPNLDTFDPSRHPTDYIEHMNNRRNIIENDTRKYQRYYDEQRTKHKEIYSEDNPNPKFKVGQFVMCYTGDQLVGNVKKLTTNWQGPYEIIRLSNDGQIATIANVHNPDNIFNANVNQLKIWRPKEENLWMESPLVYCMSICQTRIEYHRSLELLKLEMNMIDMKIPKITRDKFHIVSGEKVSKNPLIRKDIMIIEQLVSLQGGVLLRH